LDQMLPTAKRRSVLVGVHQHMKYSITVTTDSLR
jgi:hypothetical protein